MEIVNLPKSSVCRAVKKIQESKTDFINSLKNKTPRKVSSEVETRQQFIKNTVEDLLNSNPGFTQGGIQQKLREMGYTCSQPTVSRIIKKLNFKRKRLTKIPEGRNCPSTLESRRQYVLSIMNRQDREFIFLDETGFNLHTSNHYGYARPKLQSV